MAKDNNPLSLRLSPETRAQIAALMAKTGWSQTKVIEEAIARLHHEECATLVIMSWMQVRVAVSVACSDHLGEIAAGQIAWQAVLSDGSHGEYMCMTCMRDE